MNVNHGQILARPERPHAPVPLVSCTLTYCHFHVTLWEFFSWVQFNTKDLPSDNQSRERGHCLTGQLLHSQIHLPSGCAPSHARQTWWGPVWQGNRASWCLILVYLKFFRPELSVLKVLISGLSRILSSFQQSLHERHIQPEN